MKLFQVHSHRQLCAKNGDLVASGGEKVPADHPAVLALIDPPAIGRFLEEPTPPAAAAHRPTLRALPKDDIGENHED